MHVPCFEEWLTSGSRFWHLPKMKKTNEKLFKTTMKKKKLVKKIDKLKLEKEEDKQIYKNKQKLKKYKHK